jgi:hypothetical protein
MEAIKHEHKQQLHERVLERCSELKASLKSLQKDPQSAKSERARAVEESLAALDTHMTSGWEAIGEAESAALTRWLESSRFLFDSQPVPEVKTTGDVKTTDELKAAAVKPADLKVASADVKLAMDVKLAADAAPPSVDHK